MAKAKARAKTKSAGAGKVAITVTPSGSRSIHEIAGDLKAAGFDVGQVLDTIGSITGSAPRSLIGKLEKIEGVGKGRVVEDHADFQLPPAGEPQ